MIYHICMQPTPEILKQELLSVLMSSRYNKLSEQEMIKIAMDTIINYSNHQGWRVRCEVLGRRLSDLDENDYDTP